jgi:GT2 family glycosyltransferase
MTEHTRPDPRTSVVVLTHNRVDEVLRTLANLQALPEAPHIVLIDNASTDGTAARVRAAFPAVELVVLPVNLGAAGRNAGAARVRTPFVAFSDDDSWWAPGALRRAADVLDAHPDVAAVAAKVLVGPANRIDPTNLAMAASPLGSRGLPGPALTGFMAGAVVLRRRAFLEAGGYEPRLFIGAEEALLGLDLLSRGWRIVYMADVTAHHHPSLARDPAARHTLHTRNLLWLAWLRLPWPVAWADTWRLLRAEPHPWRAESPLWHALRGLPWVMRRRRRLSPKVLGQYLAVRRHVSLPEAASLPQRRQTG